MPAEVVIESDLGDAMGVIGRHLIEQLVTLNSILSEIEERLRGIEQRLSYAQVLDSQD